MSLGSPVSRTIAALAIGALVFHVLDQGSTTSIALRSYAFRGLFKQSCADRSSAVSQHAWQARFEESLHCLDPRNACQWHDTPSGIAGALCMTEGYVLVSLVPDSVLCYRERDTRRAIVEDCCSTGGTLALAVYSFAWVGLLFVSFDVVLWLAWFVVRDVMWFIGLFKFVLWIGVTCAFGLFAAAFVPGVFEHVYLKLARVLLSRFAIP